MNKIKRTVYDREFKLMVINLCLSGKTASSVAEDMDLDKSMVRRWVREHNKYQDNSFQGNGNVIMTDSEEEIYRLKLELKQVKIERDILKKAVGIFSKSDSTNMNL
ncbi:transposase [Labilibaculum euxinus]